MILSPARAVLLVLGLVLGLRPAAVRAQAYGPGLPTVTPPAGTHLLNIPNGGRISTFHRGYVFLPQSETGDGCSVWDISNPAAPVKVRSGTGGGNGHIWGKVGDLFWRQYTTHEVPAGANADFLDLSKLPDIAAWTTPMSFPISGGGTLLQFFPLGYRDYDSRVTDARTGQFRATYDINQLSGVTGTGNKWRLGNLLICTPGDGQSGMAIFDISDLANIKLLDNYTGNFKQYSTSFQIWRNYVICMTGSNDNGPSGTANAVGIDISDPTDIKVAFEIPKSVLDARYVFFQDEFAFAGGFTKYQKVNMETRTVVQEIYAPSGVGLTNDFQAVPLGHVLMTTGDGFNTNFYTHQNGLDRRAPTVGFQWPKANAVNQPLTTVLGFVINETLMDQTVNDVNIRVRPVNGTTSVAADVISSQHGVINFAPKQPLAANTTYEVTFVAGGVKDVAGNGMAEYKFLFSTGSTIATNAPPTVSNVAITPASPVNAGTAVTFTATASDPNGDALSYRWDFGDGSPQTAFSTANTITKTYNTAGNYTVLVQVRDAVGEITGSTRTLVVTSPVSGPLPTRSSSIVVDNAGRKVWVVNSDNDNVAAIHADNLTVVHNVAVGKRPTGVAVDGSSQVRQPFGHRFALHRSHANGPCHHGRRG
jgi:YVTN family beta-propeller protein